MSATGLEVFDRTLHTTNTWLKEIMEALGCDRHVAWHVLGSVLRALRDRVPLELTAHLGAELPLLVRGLLYDRWHPATAPERYRSLDEFLKRIEDDLRSTRPTAPQDAARIVFTVLSRHLPEGQVEKVRHALPEDIRALWPVRASRQERTRVEVEFDETRLTREA
ncbi:DUF2267 domain-containing protein [Microvirga makkahensis]|uniref:DUF2267 domain-containing protein n=1 Tax=Microvirga makkahensis TaxID=1128670 RepID=A0A7X3MSR4_9HYPH|nr:DUF2267 domain-containing protein [Microvirga makkahensis]MXQ12552.1 DUF2267 domain-containing protein [Microvirga makkahensis]